MLIWVVKFGRHRFWEKCFAKSSQPPAIPKNKRIGVAVFWFFN
jgi:hypothetical protein